MALAKTGLTAKVSQHHAVPAGDATTPTPATPPDVASAQKQLSALQWVVPATSGALVLTGAYAGQQYRPEEVATGALRRVLS